MKCVVHKKFNVACLWREQTFIAWLKHDSICDSSFHLSRETNFQNICSYFINTLFSDSLTKRHRQARNVLLPLRRQYIICDSLEICFYWQSSLINAYSVAYRSKGLILAQIFNEYFEYSIVKLFRWNRVILTPKIINGFRNTHTIEEIIFWNNNAIWSWPEHVQYMTRTCRKIIRDHKWK